MEIAAKINMQTKNLIFIIAFLGVITFFGFIGWSRSAMAACNQECCISILAPLPQYYCDGVYRCKAVFAGYPCPFFCHCAFSWEQAWRGEFIGCSRDCGAACNAGETKSSFCGAQGNPNWLCVNPYCSEAIHCNWACSKIYPCTGSGCCDGGCSGGKCTLTSNDANCGSGYYCDSNCNCIKPKYYCCKDSAGCPTSTCAETCTYGSYSGSYDSSNCDGACYNARCSPPGSIRACGYTSGCCDCSGSSTCYMRGNEGDPDFNCLWGGCSGVTCSPNSNYCSGNSCSQTYNDYCSGVKLVEYDNDCIDDSTTVSNSCSNSCQGCTCTSCSPDCSAPSTTTHCCQGECGAECDTDSDCNNNDGWYCVGDNGCGDPSFGDEIEKRDYYCNLTDCTCDYTVEIDPTPCRCDAEDTDVPTQNYTVNGTCTDYLGCSDGPLAECQSQSFTDKCVNETNPLLEVFLNETYVSGSGDSAICNFAEINCSEELGVGSDEPGSGYKHVCYQGQCIKITSFVRLSSYFVYPGDSIEVTVGFNDTRYLEGKNTSIEILIDGEEWSDICFSKVNITNVSHERKSCDWEIKSGKKEVTCSKTGDMEALSLNSYFEVKATCIIPELISGGPHTLKVFPRYYSPAVLEETETEFFVEGEASPLQKIIVFIKSLFQKITGFFIQLR